MRIPWGSSLLGTHDHAGIQQTSTSFLFIGVILIRKIRRSQQKKYCGSGTCNPEVAGLRFEIRLQLPSTLFQARSDRLMKINIWRAGDQRKEWEERVGATEKPQVSHMLGPCAAPRPGISARGRVGGGRAESEGQQRLVHRDLPSSPKPPPEGSRPPHPFPRQRLQVRPPTALTACSRAEAGAP